jgi:hypothetical protein
MTIYYTDIHVVLDPEQSDPLPGGRRLQDVSMILTDRHDLRERPVGIALLACQARELAFCLLELAEQADHERTGR